MDITRGRSRRNSSAGFVHAAQEPPTIVEGQPLRMPHKGTDEDSALGLSLLYPSPGGYTGPFMLDCLFRCRRSHTSGLMSSGCRTGEPAGWRRTQQHLGASCKGAAACVALWRRRRALGKGSG